ncbi:Isochorismatase hydrolase [Phlegmacium glaucopus]|nr:Isochorismatase hydrolase [Phlegmacium glaucopus]
MQDHSHGLAPASTIFFLCDVQTKFRPAIHGFEHIVSTTNKMLKLAKLLNIEVVCTTQNAKGLGPTDPAIDLESLGPLLLGPYDKKLFSMIIPEVKSILRARLAVKSVVIFGIESHVCVLQTVLSLLSLQTCIPHIVIDGVSSCNSFEIPIAIERMRREGAVIGTSESIAFQLVGDASLPIFKPFSNLMKEEKDNTKKVGEALLQGQVANEGVVKSAM